MGDEVQASDEPNYVDHEHNRSVHFNYHDDFDDDPTDIVPDHDDNSNLTAADFDDHICRTHDNCRLLHLKHRSTGWWFEYHVDRTDGHINAVGHDGTSYGHEDHDHSDSAAGDPSGHGSG